jgi:hypothetical protein
MNQTVKLAGYQGQVTEPPDSQGRLIWMSNKDSLEETPEGITAKLLEFKNNPYGLPLQRTFEDDVKPKLEDTTLVEILDVYVDDFTKNVVATLKIKDQQTAVGADEQIPEELVDEAVEESFPASDPPALKSTS